MRKHRLWYNEYPCREWVRDPLSSNEIIQVINFLPKSLLLKIQCLVNDYAHCRQRKENQYGTNTA